MKNLRWMTCMLIGALAVPTAFAEDSPDSYEATRAKVTQLRVTVKREERELGFTDETLLRLDGRFEERINDLVERVTEATESVATDARMAAVKAEVIAGLRRTIDLYVKERERGRNHGWSTEPLDARIDLRLEQMTKLAASLSTDKDGAETAQPLGQGYDMEDAVVALKAGKPTGHIVASRKDLVRELQAVVDFLAERQTWMELRLPVTTDEQEKATLEKTIAAQAELIAKRRAQIEEVRNAPEPEQTKVVGVQGVSEFEKELAKARGALQADFRELLGAKAQRDYKRKKVEYLRKELAQAEATLEKLAAPEK